MSDQLYEMMYVVSPDLDDAGVEEVQKSIAGTVERFGGHS